AVLPVLWRKQNPPKKPKILRKSSSFFSAFQDLSPPPFLALEEAELPYRAGHGVHRARIVPWIVRVWRQLRGLPYHNLHDCHPVLPVQPDADGFAKIQDLILKFRSSVFEKERKCAILTQNCKIPHKWRRPCTSDDIWKPLS
ncbi:MAG: hypothetical protein K6C34_03070, partial [Alphaproteobacteria bacterium]|nr:hypothetical protein [Alphaproteobacteria bacterium]